MNEGVTIDAESTHRDHLFRDIDPYAGAKYAITMRWLEPHVRPGMTLANIGCGGGLFNEMASRRGLRVSACEPDPDAYAIATARPSAAAQDLRAVGFLEFVEGREPADFIVMHDVLEHIDDDRDAVAALHRAVKTTGRVVLSVPAMPELFGLHDEELGHFRRYRSRDLENVVRERFRIERIRFFGFASIPIAAYYSRWKRIPYPIGATTTPLGRLFALTCDVESRIALPIGTSLLTELTPR